MDVAVIDSDRLYKFLFQSALKALYEMFNAVEILDTLVYLKSKNDLDFLYFKFSCTLLDDWRC